MPVLDARTTSGVHEAEDDPDGISDHELDPDVHDPDSESEH